MPTYQAPATWTALQAIQYLIQSQVLVGGLSPFSVWNPTDQAKYGANNPNGSITNAIYIGVPKDWQSATYLPNQCHIVPPMSEDVYRRALGGKVWDWGDIIILFWFNRKNDWYAAMQNLLAARDAMYPMLGQHAELPGAPVVIAGDIKAGTGAHNGYNVANVIGEDWDMWGFTWKIKQEYYIPGGITS